jgi:hypothetical protein
MTRSFGPAIFSRTSVCLQGKKTFAEQLFTGFQLSARGPEVTFSR